MPVENFLDEGKIIVCGKIIGLSILKMKSYNKKMLVLIKSKNLIRLSFCNRHHPFSTYVAFSEKLTFISFDDL